MLKPIAAAVAVLVVSLAVFVATRPDTFRIERSAVVRASPATTFALINDFQRWPRWSPYETVDPNMARTYEGPGSGVGAMYSWKGNSDIGSGRMTIEESRPGEQVSIKLEFFAPFTATNQARFQLVPEGQHTRVTWSMEGPNTLLGKAMSAFGLMDSFVGKQLETGLANLDAVVAAEATTQSARAQAGAAPPAPVP
ncbi:SRPBCC family protein [Myxococcus sp. K15C18031901]|uniref:SRPBCC family protein n=1 Tax=Myxococcus dinghuensis TaxID=2906761 RepID=UPI0020A7FDB3|nr:SRPBCC family protein [Myxococcus dinghuensis]MCP3098923.1 SRPBCC family protein [Myxococcus dinghuensis]